jgi:hypothetical protein
VVWKLGDRARVNSNSCSNYDSNRNRVGVVIEIDEEAKSLTVRFNDEFTPLVLKDPDMKTDQLTDNFRAFTKPRILSNRNFQPRSTKSMAAMKVISRGPSTIVGGGDDKINRNTIWDKMSQSEGHIISYPKGKTIRDYHLILFSGTKYACSRRGIDSLIAEGYIREVPDAAGIHSSLKVFVGYNQVYFPHDMVKHVAEEHRLQKRIRVAAPSPEALSKLIKTVTDFTMLSGRAVTSRELHNHIKTIHHKDLTLRAKYAGDSQTSAYKNFCAFMKQLAENSQSLVVGKSQDGSLKPGTYRYSNPAIPKV